MTYVEFFDKSSVLNLCSCLTNAPERVIFLGGDVKRISKYAKRYEKIFKARGFKTEIICKGINKNYLMGIVDELSLLVQNYDDIAFDLTGGDDLFLTAIGIVFERYKDKNLQMHRFVIRNNTLYDCDKDGKTIEKNDVYLTVDEHIKAYGGDVVYCDEKENTTFEWTMDDVFTRDVEQMWEICKQNPRKWNAQIGILALAEKYGVTSPDDLTVTIKVSYLKEKLRNIKMEGSTEELLLALHSQGLIEYKLGDTLEVSYKNEQVKRCLTKAGMALEMKVFSKMLSIVEDGKPAYDVKNGVFIDWDGRIRSDNGKSYDTENEIDVLAVHGVIPVFISCKNGFVDMSELYKLNSVAGRFGGEYSKKVLIITSLKKGSPFATHFKQRATDMNIRIIDNLVEMNDKEMKRLFSNLWR